MMFDRDSHVLIAKNTRDNLRLIEDLIDVLDVTPPQVLIEARFISTSINDLRELGVNWNSDELQFKTGDHENPQAVLKPGKVIQTGQVVTPTLDATLAYHGLLSTPMFEVIIQALEESGKAQTLSVPRVTTLNNQPARIRIGEDFLYFEDFELQEVSNGQNDSGQNQYVSQLVPVGTPTKEELGIILEVTPSVGADRQTVTLNLKPEISEFVRFEVYDVGTGGGGDNNNGTSASNGLSVLKLPIFRRSEIETKVAVRSGDTVVMGGLIAASQGKQVRRVPFLGSIPFLGALFRYEQTSNDRRNLLIFVTARILAESGEELVPFSIMPPAAAL
jgi:type II secretory pathway component GspD/PulD (secretin)